MIVYETLLVETQGRVSMIRLNRVAKHNAINNTMAEELSDCFAALVGSDNVEVIVITGAGERAFCSGADLADYQAATVRTPIPTVFGQIARARKPTIASVNGYAHGGGAALAIACDLRICSDTAQFCFLGVRYGLIVGASRLPRIVGGARAKELIFSARNVDAEEAARIGLANRTVAGRELDHEVWSLAHSIANQSPAALAASKEVIELAMWNPVAAERLEEMGNVILRSSQDHQSRFQSHRQHVGHLEASSPSEPQ